MIRKIQMFVQTHLRHVTADAALVAGVDRTRHVVAIAQRIVAVMAAAGHREQLGRHRDQYLPKIRGLIEVGQATPAPDYERAKNHQRVLARDILTCFDEVDVLLTPATLGPAPDLSTTGDPAFNSPWSFTGLPTVSLAVGLAPDGLPLALRLVGCAFAETKLFRCALWCEQASHAQGFVD